MKVYLTCTPEFSIDKLAEVIDLLSGIPGELKFCKGRTLTQNQFARLNQKFSNIDQISSLNFEELFDLVQGYRDWDCDLKKIGDDDFVILISSIKNSKNWFSAFRNKNIFIHGDEWDLISDVDSKFGIAYECIENVFQSLIGLNIENPRLENSIHWSSKGCINDFCEKKTDIIMKLQSASICPSCYRRSVEKGVNDFIMTHIIGIMEEIRKEFVISKKFGQQISLEKIQVDDKGKVSIGGKVIKMETLPKTMYIGFLKKIDGIPSDKKCENKDIFEEIYLLIKKNPDPLVIQKLCCSKIQHKNSIERQKTTFETNRSKIRTALKKVLGQTLANYYSVNLVKDRNSQTIFKVNLKKEHLDISTNFNKTTI